MITTQPQASGAPGTSSSVPRVARLHQPAAPGEGGSFGLARTAQLQRRVKELEELLEASRVSERLARQRGEAALETARSTARGRGEAQREAEAAVRSASAAGGWMGGWVGVCRGRCAALPVGGAIKELCRDSNSGTINREPSNQSPGCPLCSPPPGSDRSGLLSRLNNLHHPLCSHPPGSDRSGLLSRLDNLHHPLCSHPPLPPGSDRSGLLSRLDNLQRFLHQERAAREALALKLSEEERRGALLASQLEAASRQVAELRGLLQEAGRDHDGRAEAARQVRFT